MADATKIPLRSEVDPKDRWDLSRLFADAAAWEAALAQLAEMIPKIAGLKPSLGSSPENFASVLAFYADYGLLQERLGSYAARRQSEDEGDTVAQGRFARFMMTATEGQGAWAWLAPAIQSLPEAFVGPCLADPRFADYAVFLRKLLRFKPHILSEAEERLLALQMDSSQVPEEAFSLLTNVDIDFGTIQTAEGNRPLSQSSYSSLIRNPDRSVREAAYKKFYAAYDAHKNTIGALYAGSVKQDAYRAKIRNYPSARAAALFPDDVPETVYDNLVSTIGDNLGVLHEYYELRRRALGLDELRHWDVYVPMVPETKTLHGYDEAVDLVCEALAPLGDEYVSVLREGIAGRRAGPGRQASGGWVDRFENKGKTSGAYSAGTFSGEPYILLNYKDDVIHDVFTLAHEGGHSMHSWYSARSNPFLCYDYTIFEAEVASTFNEQLLFYHLYERAGSDAERASLVNAKLDDLIGTLFRQAMFAEFEKKSHEMHEAGEPLTVDALRAAYRSLLERYFGKALKLEEVSDLECLRIPHFYHSFYVYKYSTGISASIALAERVRAGGKREREDYFAFLRSGGSRFPIEALELAGVDMSRSAPIEAACAEFGRYTEQLKRLLKL